MKVVRLFLFSFVIPVVICTLTFSPVYSQLGEWTWVKGASSDNSPGNHGIMGVPSSANEPASRYACGSWTDTTGNFWIYSGVNAPGDLWKFDTKTSLWTWMNGDTTDPSQYIESPLGVYDPLNSPGQLGYGMLSWITPDNHLWLYGGLLNTSSSNSQQGLLISDDLWQYDPTINEWAWMGEFGPANYGTMGIGDTTTMPGGRQEGNCTWTDNNGNLWLFGGCDVNLKSYNDMWQYNVKTGIWTWVSGSKKADDHGQYGTIGQPATGRYPWARSTNFFWKDTSGNFWLSGGTNYTSDYMFQDTWKFDVISHNWTWVNGIQGPTRSTNTAGNCVFDSSNTYGPHYENRATWKHCEDLIITYNGFTDWGTGSVEEQYLENDMWGYKISEDEWVRLNDWGYTGTYGTQNTPNPLNYPPSRIGGVGFTAKDGSLWLFGGQNVTGFLNDLWKYVIDTACVTCTRSCKITAPVIVAAADIFCANDSTTICAPNSYTTYAWNVSGTGSCITVNEAGNYYVTVSESNGCTAESNHIPIRIYPVSPVAITQHGDTLTSFGSVGYQWYLNGTAIPGANTDFYIAKQPGSYTIAATDTNGCVALSNPVAVTGINDLHEEVSVSLFPNPNSSGSWQLSVDEVLVGSKLEIYDDNGRMVWRSEVRSPKSQITPNVESGIYWLRIYSPNVSVVRKLIKL